MTSSIQKLPIEVLLVFNRTCTLKVIYNSTNGQSIPEHIKRHLANIHPYEIKEDRQAVLIVVLFDQQERLHSGEEHLSVGNQDPELELQMF